MAPVTRLLEHLDKGQYHRIREQFETKQKCEDFCGKFNMLDNNGLIIAGCFRRNFIIHERLYIIPLSSNVFPAFEMRLEFKELANPSYTVLVDFQTGYDIMAQQYFIEDVQIIGDLDPNLDCGDIGPPPPPVIPGPTDPFLSECAQNSTGGFTYVKLKSRELPITATSSSSDPDILGETPSPDIVVLDDYFNSGMFRQILFQPFTYSTSVLVDFLSSIVIPNPVYVGCLALGILPGVCSGCGFLQLCIDEFITIPFIDQLFDTQEQIYSPGYVLSIADLTANEVEDAGGNPVELFSNIYDTYGIFEVPNFAGVLQDFPVGASVDRLWKRVVVNSSNDNKSTIIGGFTDPVAVTILGQHIYILDRGAQEIAVYLMYVDVSNELVVTLIAKTNFGLDLTGATDVTGFNFTNQNVLYISSEINTLFYRIIIDPVTGLQKAGADGPRTITEYTDAAGDVHSLEGVIRFESSLRAGGHNVLLAINKRENMAMAFSTDGLAASSDMDLIVKTKFPSSSKLTNVGYNLGNNAFYITDEKASKIHGFTNDGNYLASQGSFGTSETNNEFFFPNAISSNHFATDANQILIANKWGTNTGLKQMKPVADVVNLHVIEKCPITMAGLSNNSLNFRFSLTDGEGVSQVVLKLNGNIIRTLTTSNTTFLPESYSENFLVNATGSNGVQGLLNYGWNSYAIRMDGQITEGSTVLEYQKIREIEFYHIPTSITDMNFTVDNVTTASLFHNDSDDPFLVYKNVFVPGSSTPSGINFTIQNGKTILLQGCVLTINKPTFFNVDNEEFEFACGANLKLIMQSGVNKTLTNSIFNGKFESDDMVTCTGDFTGSQQPHTSKLEFIDCTFKDYIGIALDVFQGRATIVNCNFDPSVNSADAPVGILVSPSARIDVLGGDFDNNSIGIDGNLSELFIGSTMNMYKGISINTTSFFNNGIGVHCIGTDCKLTLVEFTNNANAIMHISGTLDIEENSRNIFDNNNQAIIFSDILLAERGKNRFINNVTDITFIEPVPTQQFPASTNVECNYWRHGTSNVPVFATVSDPPNSFFMNFDYIPFLTLNQGGQYICISTDNNQQTQKTGPGTNSSPFHAAHAELNDQLLANEAELFRNNINSMISQNDYSLILGYYPDYEDTIKAYNELLIKNALFMYLRQKSLTEANNVLEEDDQEYVKLLFDQDINHTNRYDKLVNDRLTFMEFFLKERTDPIDTKRELLNMTIINYPNPFSETTRISIDTKITGICTFLIYDIQNRLVKVVFRDFLLQEGINEFNVTLENQASGLYFGILKDANSIIGTSKFVLTK